MAVIVPIAPASKTTNYDVKSMLWLTNCETMIGPLAAGVELVTQLAARPAPLDSPRGTQSRACLRHG
jgi:hypothetical protein